MYTVNFNVKIPLNKIDEEQRIVVGRATQEIEDKSGEIMDYQSSKPNFKAWSDDFAKRTQGKSYGNLRQQHDPHKAIGKLIEPPVFNDDEKAIDICAKVVDNDAWELVKSGVLNAFSIGGKYGHQWFDDDNIYHYEAIPAEISLVDNPCCSTAIVEYIKTDGSSEHKVLRNKGEIKLTDEMKKEVGEMLKSFKADMINEIKKAVKPDDEKNKDDEKPADNKKENEKSADDEADKTIEPAEKADVKSANDCFKDCEKALENADDKIKDSCNKLFHKMVEKGLYCKCDKCAKAVESVAEKSDADNDLNKADSNNDNTNVKAVESEQLAKAIDVINELKKGFDALKADNDDLRKQVDELGNMPMQGGAIVANNTMAMDKTVGIMHGKETANNEADMLRKLRDEADSAVMKQAYSEQLAKLELKKMFK